MKPLRITAPAEPVVTPDAAKLQLRVDGTDEDTLIEGLIAAATAHLDGIEGVMGRCIVTQEWAQSFDRLSGDVVLPFPDVQTAAITYSDTAGDPQTVPVDDYRLHQVYGGSVLGLVSGAAWPQGASDDREAFTVTFTAGFGNAAAVPASIKHAILMLVAHWYENREAVGKAEALPMAFHALIAPYRPQVV